MEKGRKDEGTRRGEEEEVESRAPPLWEGNSMQRLFRRHIIHLHQRQDDVGKNLGWWFDSFLAASAAQPTFEEHQLPGLADNALLGDIIDTK